MDKVKTASKNYTDQVDTPLKSELCLLPTTYSLLPITYYPSDLDSYTGHIDSTQDKVSQLFVIEAGGRHRHNDKKL